MVEAKSIGWWNQWLCDWFFPRRGPRHVYLDCSDAELELMNASFALGLEDPVGALLHTVGLYPLPRSDHRWRQEADGETPPPWLAYLAVTVLVVDREAEKGSIRFYEPLADALGRRRMTQFEYESTFFRWWNELSWWLLSVNEGARGLPTWSAIPESPLPRSVIGHPYTQVFLRREDREDLDEFLAALADVTEGEVEVEDRPAAAEELLRRLDRWVTSGASVSGHLRSILSSGKKEDRATLGFVLLGRLLDAVTPPVPTAHSPTLRIAPTFDEWNRRLHLSVVAPSWASVERPLNLEGLGIELDEPGQPVHLSITPTPEALRDGLTLESGDYTLILRRAESYFLSARDFSEWVAISDPAADEAVYALVPDGMLETQYGEWPQASSCADMPPGWVLLGPGTLGGGAHVAAPTPVPRLVGGLRLDSRQFVHGGEPRLELPEGDVLVHVDGEPHRVGDSVDLATYRLEPGEHSVVVGPFRLSFWSIATSQLPTVEHPLCRLPNDDIELDDVALRDSEWSICGIASFPRRHELPKLYLCPADEEVTLLGEPGQAVRTRTGMAAWAVDVELGRYAFDPTERSSYPRLRRPMRYPWWVVGDASSWVMRVHSGLDGNEVPKELEPWSRIVSAIGESPRIIEAGPPPDDPADVARTWLSYRAQGAL